MKFNLFARLENSYHRYLYKDMINCMEGGVLLLEKTILQASSRLLMESKFLASFVRYVPSGEREFFLPSLNSS